MYTDQLWYIKKDNLIFYISVGIIPRNWRRYTVPAGLTVLQWVADFSERIKQLQNISNQVSREGSHILKVNELINGCINRSMN